jgi:hypothetical protein
VQRRFQQTVFQAGCVGVDDFGDTGDLGCGLCGGTGVVAGDEHVHVAAAGCSGGDGVEGCAVLMHDSVVVFSNNEYRTEGVVLGGRREAFKSLSLRS